MPLNDFDKYASLIAQRDAESSPRMRRKMEDAAFKYLRQDIKRSKPFYGVRSSLLFFLACFLFIALLVALLFWFFPYRIALTICIVSLLALVGLCILIYRSTGHLSQEAFVESFKIWQESIGRISKPLAGKLPQLEAEDPPPKIDQLPSLPTSRKTTSSDVPKVEL